MRGRCVQGGWYPVYSPGRQGGTYQEGYLAIIPREENYCPTVKRVGHLGVPVSGPPWTLFRTLNVLNVQYVRDLTTGQQ